MIRVIIVSILCAIMLGCSNNAMDPDAGGDSNPVFDESVLSSTRKDLWTSLMPFPGSTYTSDTSVPTCQGSLSAERSLNCSGTSGIIVFDFSTNDQAQKISKIRMNTDSHFAYILEKSKGHFLAVNDTISIPFTLYPSLENSIKYFLIYSLDLLKSLETDLVNNQIDVPVAEGALAVLGPVCFDNTQACTVAFNAALNFYKTNSGHFASLIKNQAIEINDRYSPYVFDDDNKCLLAYGFEGACSLPAGE